MAYPPSVLVRKAPASIGQRLLWMLDHYRGADGALNCPVLCRLRGPLDTAALRGALDDLVGRHEALRTRFAGRGPGLTQLVHCPQPLPLRVVELTGTGDVEAALQRAVAEELRARVDPTAWPVRAILWHLADGDHVLCLNMHHLVTDASSCAIVFRDLCQLYGRRCGGRAELPEIGWQYAQFAAWQHRQLAGDGLRGHHDYWRRQLTGAQFPALPGTRRPVGRTTPRTARESVDIGEALVTSLREVARSCRATLFAVMLAVYYAQLHRITGQGDLAVASLFANRTRPEVAHTVGFLANMVVLRTRLRRAATFADLVRETHRTVTGALMHQELPYQMVPLDIAQANGVRADDVVFQIMAEPLHTMRIAGLEAEALVPEGVGSRFALELALVPRGGGFRAVLFHAEDRFPRAFACDVLAGYASLAASVATAPGMPLASLRG